ncbi:MAG: efflux RND transporter periplasmic adaptor subunit [Polyangiaceae bacterium]
MTRIAFLGSAAVLSAALLAAGCKKPAPTENAKPAAAADQVQAAIDVKVVKVQTRKLPATLEMSGTLVADESSDVASNAAGIVTKVHVDVGTRVKKGDPLVELDRREPSLRGAAASAQAAQARARLGIKDKEKFEPEKMAEVRAAKEAMDLAVTDAERTKALFDQGGVPQATWDLARARAEQAKAQYDAALNGAQQAWAGLLAAQAQAGLASKAVADATIRAPFDGAVAEKRISVGEFASPGRVVAVVVHDTLLRLKIDIPEVDAARVGMGKEVLISVAAYPGRVFKGEIKRIGASVRAQNRTLPVEAELANDDGALKPGMFARAEIVVDGAEADALLVPRDAIGTSGTASRVFVRSGNRVVERLVTIGREVEGLVEVRGTLAPTDEIAVTSVDKLSDGAEIKVE